MTTPTTRDDWQQRAGCSGQDPEMWFHAGEPSTAAVDTCRRCPVRAECLHNALTYDAPNGVWGGLTRSQREAIPALPHTSRGEDLALLRTHLARLDDTPSHGGTEPMTQPAPTPPTTDAVPNPAPAPQFKGLPVGKLLAWGEAHTDPDVQAQAARARAALTGLRNRHAADRELESITAEEEKLTAQLAELRLRKAQLLPKKRAAKKKPLGYPATEVRAWARTSNIPCPAVGRVPADVVTAWRTATGQAAADRP